MKDKKQESIKFLKDLLSRVENDVILMEAFSTEYKGRMEVSTMYFADQSKKEEPIPIIINKENVTKVINECIIDAQKEVLKKLGVPSDIIKGMKFESSKSIGLDK